MKKDEEKNNYIIFLKSDDTEKIRLFSLVLTARGIPHLLKLKDDHLQIVSSILVEEHFFDKARDEIELFCKENRQFLSKEKAKKGKPRQFLYLKKSLVSILVLISFMSVTFRYEVRDFLLKNFSADAEKILDGELWRVLSALFLHSDPSHFFSNAFMAALFFIILFEETGLIKGWLIVFFSGGLGNYLTALVYRKDHISIGLSTAIFGAIGAFCVIKIIKEHFKGAKEGFKVFLSGLALLGMLGTGPGNTDILAHFFGFFSGIFIGALFFVPDLLTHD